VLIVLKVDPPEEIAGSEDQAEVPSSTPLYESTDSLQTDQTAPLPLVSAANGSAPSSSSPPDVSNGFEKLVKTLSPLPKASIQRTRKCKTESAANVTASPYKNMLVKKQEAVEHQLEKKKQRAEKKAQNQIKPVTSRDSTQSRGCQCCNSRKAGSNAENKETRGGKIRNQKVKAKKAVSRPNDEKWTCKRCNFDWGSETDSKNDEDWYSCVVCQNKYHESCAWEDGIIDDDDQLTCRDCL